MASFKLTISDKKGRSITKEIKENDANPLLGLKVGNEVDAAIVGLGGKMKITGGSDKSGVPMRSDLHGGSRKYLLLSKGVGLQDVEKGQRVRKLVRGNTISEEIYQLNCKFDGEIKIEKTEEPTKETKKDEPAKEIKKEAKKDEPAKEVKKDEAAKKAKKDEPAKEVKKEAKKE